MSWVAIAGPARADVGLSADPSGWEADAEAVLDRAEGWAEAVGGSVIDVYGPSDAASDDDLIALLQTPGQLTRADLDDPATLADSYAPVFGAEQAVSVDTVDFGEDVPPGIRARYESGDDVVELIVVSSGDNRGLLLFATTTDGEKLYSPLFEASIDELTGIEGPAARFDQSRWRMGFAAGWLISALLLVVVLRLVSSGDSATQIGRRAAAVLVGVSLVAMGVAYAILGDSEPSIVAAGLTRVWLVAEAGLMGLLIAGVLMVVASIISAASRPIQSAPTGGGTWGPRAVNTPAIPVVPQVPQPAGHPDGSSVLTDAHKQVPPQLGASGVPAPPAPPQAPAPSPAAALADGTLTAPSPTALSGSGPLSGSNVAPARTAPIVLRGSDKLAGRAAPAPSSGANLGAPEQPVSIDRTLVGQGPKAKPMAFPTPMSSPPPAPDDEGTD